MIRLTHGQGGQRVGIHGHSRVETPRAILALQQIPQSALDAACVGVERAGSLMGFTCLQEWEESEGGGGYFVLVGAVQRPVGVGRLLSSGALKTRGCEV